MQAKIFSSHTHHLNTTVMATVALSADTKHKASDTVHSKYPYPDPKIM